MRSEAEVKDNLELGNPAKVNGKEDWFACVMAVCIAVQSAPYVLLGIVFGYRVRILLEKKK